MKLLEVLKMLKGKPFIQPEYSGNVRQVRFTDRDYLFALAPTPKGMQLTVTRKGNVEFFGIVTGRDNDFTTLIEHIEGLKDTLTPDYASFEITKEDRMENSRFLSFIAFIANIFIVAGITFLTMAAAAYIGFPPFLIFIPMLFGVAFGILALMAIGWIRTHIITKLFDAVDWLISRRSKRQGR